MDLQTHVLVNDYTTSINYVCNRLGNLGLTEIFRHKLVKIHLVQKK